MVKSSCPIINRIGSFLSGSKTHVFITDEISDRRILRKNNLFNKNRLLSDDNISNDLEFLLDLLNILKSRLTNEQQNKLNEVIKIIRCIMNPKSCLSEYIEKIKKEMIEKATKNLLGDDYKKYKEF